MRLREEKQLARDVRLGRWHRGGSRWSSGNGGSLWPVVLLLKTHPFRLSAFAFQPSPGAPAQQSWAVGPRAGGGGGGVPVSAGALAGGPVLWPRAALSPPPPVLASARVSHSPTAALPLHPQTFCNTGVLTESHVPLILYSLLRRRPRAAFF